MAEQSTRVPSAVKVTCMIDHPTIKKKEIDLRLTAEDWSKSLSVVLTKIHRRFPFLSAMQESQWTLCINGETIDKSSVEAYKNSIAKTPAGQSKPHVQIIETAAMDGGGGHHGQWQCGRCTLYNTNETPRCAVCDAARGGGDELANEEEDNAPSRHIRVVFNDKSFAWVPPSTNNDADNEEADDDEKQWDAHYASFIQQAKQQFDITAHVDDIQLQSVMGGNSCDLEGAGELHDIWSEMDESDDDTEVPVIKVIAPDEPAQPDPVPPIVPEGPPVGAVAEPGADIEGSFSFKFSLLGTSCVMTDYAQLSYVQLKQKCTALGLPTNGTKQDYVVRLQKHGQAAHVSAAPTRSTSNDDEKIVESSTTRTTHLNLKPGRASKHKRSESVVVQSQPRSSKTASIVNQNELASASASQLCANSATDEKDKLIVDLARQLNQKTQECKRFQAELAQLKRETNDTRTSVGSSSAADQLQHSIVGELQGLITVLVEHVMFTEQQKVVVDKQVEAYERQFKTSNLSVARDNALKTQKDLLKEIMSIPAMYKFLDKIILIENLFNSFYKTHKDAQQRAREEHAERIAAYEKMPKPVCEVESFVDLLFAGSVHIAPFERLMNEIRAKCKAQQPVVRVVDSSGAKGKRIERAFYKAFFVYRGDQGYKNMTDVLRCSLVFDRFDDLYRCFGVIEAVMADKGGILRCKDRFHPERVEFGYRDLLINVLCPGSNIVCEIQLHHNIFYHHKGISHGVYKIARLFDQNGKNQAYEYATKYNRERIGDSVYKYRSQLQFNQNQHQHQNQNQYQWQHQNQRQYQHQHPRQQHQYQHPRQQHQYQHPWPRQQHQYQHQHARQMLVQKKVHVQSFTCNHCNVTCNSEQQWKTHINGKNHQQLAAKNRGDQQQPSPKSPKSPKTENKKAKEK